MSSILPSRPNRYTGSPLDRAGHLRVQRDEITGMLVAPGTRFVPVWRGLTLLREDAAGAPEAVFPAGVDAAAYPWAFLGRHAGDAYFAVDLSAEDDPLVLLSPGGAFTELRMVGAGMPGEQAAIVAHARGLMHWRSRHRFCGVCGGACEPISAGNTMACTLCQTHHFPRTDPAVIMLVTRGDSVLLGHSQRFPTTTMYSTLAGFVEPGESLEEAVAREVLEESAIRVGRVTYHSSQPWPFPASLMLGFYAEGLSDEITIDPAELTDARWFSRDMLRDPKQHGFSLPRADSIARRLIEDWIAA